MQTKTLLPALLLLVALTTACGPLVPLSYVKGRYDNQLTQSIETEDATVYLNYINSENSYYIFDLEIINRSSETLAMAPQRINMFASPNRFAEIKSPDDDVYKLSAMNSALTMRRQFANSPAATRKVYYDKIKAKRAAAGFFAVLAAGIIVYDAVKDDNDYHKESWTKKDTKNSFGRDLMVTAALAASDISKTSIAKAEEDSRYVPYELFPECNIKPGDQVRGKIFIPIEASYRYTRVVVPFANTDFVFDFKREGVKSKPSRSR